MYQQKHIYILGYLEWKLPTIIEELNARLLSILACLCLKPFFMKDGVITNKLYCPSFMKDGANLFKSQNA